MATSDENNSQSEAKSGPTVVAASNTSSELDFAKMSVEEVYMLSREFVKGDASQKKKEL